MITGVHTMFYSSEVEALRALIRDKLGFTCTDVGGGWLIFDLPGGELGCHATGPGSAPSGTHYISFICDEIETTVSDLQSRGVVFDNTVADAGYGLAIHFTMPGVHVELYQPNYR